MIDDFSAYPRSVNEIRSAASADAADWTPRDCLIEVLRRIDSGENITDVVICYRYVIDGKNRHHFTQATKDGLVTLGLLSVTAHRMVES